MRKRKFSKNEIEDFVKNSKTYADVCRKYGIVRFLPKK